MEKKYGGLFKSAKVIFFQDVFFDVRKYVLKLVFKNYKEYPDRTDLLLIKYKEQGFFCL